MCKLALPLGHNCFQWSTNGHILGSTLPSFYTPFRAVRGSRRGANVQTSKAVERKICVELLSGEGGILKEKVKAIELCSKPLLRQL